MNADNLRGLSRFLARGVLSQGELSAGKINAELGALEGRIGALLSLLLAGVKALLAFLTGSVALMADALNNFGDLASSTVLIFGYRLSKKPRDAKHPYGYGRLRTIAGLILAIILILVGFETAKAGIGRILKPQPFEAGIWVVVAIALSICLKAWLAIFARSIAKITDDPALKSEFWNHFFDIFSTLFVLLALLSNAFDWISLDGWAALGISFFIAFTGFSYLRETVRILLGTAPSDDDLRSVRRLAMGVGGVEGVHDIQIHEYGNMRLIIMHIEMDAGATALECHSLTEEVEDVVGKRFGAKVNVHGDPVDLSHPEYRNIRSSLNDFIDSSRDFTDFHDLRVSGTRPELLIEVDLVIKPAVESAEFAAKVDWAHRELAKLIDGFELLDIGLETNYASEPEFRRIFRDGCR